MCISEASLSQRLIVLIVALLLELTAAYRIADKTSKGRTLAKYLASRKQPRFSPALASIPVFTGIHQTRKTNMRYVLNFPEDRVTSKPIYLSFNR